MFTRSLKDIIGFNKRKRVIALSLSKGGKSGHHPPPRRGEAYGLTTRRGNTRGANRDGFIQKDKTAPQCGASSMATWK